MSKQIIRLCRLQLTNLFGFNEFRYTKDKGKKGRYLALAAVWLLLIAMAVTYVSALSYGLVYMGMAEIVPMYLYGMASLLILMFSFFKAGSTIFSMKGFEILVSLPVSRAAIIISRFGCMYLTNLMLEFVIMLPGLVCYGYFVRPAVGFYFVFLLGSLFLPLLPLTISSILGAAITAVSSRMRHKSLAESLLAMAVVVAVMVGTWGLSDQGTQMSKEALQNMAEMISAQVGSIYPPAIWFSNALSGDIAELALLLAVPAAIFTAFVAVLQKYFLNICAAVHAVTTKNNYQMTRLQKSSHVTALWRRELKRYFSSSVYVTNTLVGYVLAVLASAAILIAGMDKVVSTLEIPGAEAVIMRCFPYGISCLLCMTNITACSISIEGNTFWQMQSLPVTTKEFYDSKILANLSIAAPFYLLSVILLGIAVRPAGLALVWLLVIPVCYILFCSVAGITVNLMFPIFNWESEVRVVKQSASMMVAMLMGMIVTVLPVIATAVAGDTSANGIGLFTVVILVAATVILYKKNQKVRLAKIGEGC